MKYLEPIIRIVGQLSFGNKLRATALVFGLPLLVTAGLLFYSLNTRVTELRQERSALSVQLPTLTLIARLHQASAVRQAIDEGAEQVVPLSVTTLTGIAQAMQALPAAYAGIDLPRGTAEQPLWLGRWEDLGKHITTLDGVGMAELALALRGELEKLNERMGLLIDGDATNSRLLDIMTTHVPSLIETTGRAAQIGSVVLVKKSIRGSKRTELTVQRGNFDALVQWSMEGLQKVGREHPDRMQALDAAGAQLNTAYLGIQEALTIKMLDTMDYDMAPEAFLALTAKSFDDTISVGAIISREADSMLSARLDGVVYQRNTVVAVMLAIFAAVIAGFIAAYISIMRGLDGLSDAVDTMTAGNLDVRAEVHTRDEIGKLAVQFNTMAESLALRTAQLREKTNDIHGMLHNMPQGILTIVSGGLIHHEYSTFLESLYETENIAGQPALPFLLNDSNVGTDILSQIDVSLTACLGEDRMNFEFNSHLLIPEITKTFANGRKKILDLTWSPICDENDVVEKIMVCVRDVTELRVLELEAQHQKRELDMIGQILKVTQEKFQEFIDSARGFIAANTKLLEEAPGMSPELVTQLFRNMHTIKGNARTFGLLHLTNVVHEAEQAYDELRKNPEAVFDRQALLGQLQEVTAGIDEYATLNDVTLGRKGPGRRGNAERYVMVERHHVDGLIGVLSAYDLHAARPETLAALLEQVKLDLRLIGTEPVRSILDSVFESLPSLAQEVGKAPPILVVNDHGIHIRNQVSDLLRNVFMHLYRNSMDHGIELPAERQAKGKADAGTIQLELALVEATGTLEFRLKDDGKGLALSYIRQKGLDKGMLTPEIAKIDEEVAKLIFAAGLSTAKAVTEVSGRGVGMDAVQDFIKREGGSIQLSFLDDQVGADFRAFETVITLPGKFAVSSVLPGGLVAPHRDEHLHSTKVIDASSQANLGFQPV